MAALDFIVPVEKYALPAALTTALRLTAPANQRVRIKRVHVSFDGVNANAVPVPLTFYRGSTGGTWTASPPTPRLVREGLPETVQTTVQWKATAEPTYGTSLGTRYVPPYGGWIDLDAALLEELEMKGGGVLDFTFAAAAAVNVNLTVYPEE